MESLQSYSYEEEKNKYLYRRYVPWCHEILIKIELKCK